MQIKQSEETILIVTVDELRNLHKNCETNTKTYLKRILDWIEPKIDEFFRLDQKIEINFDTKIATRRCIGYNDLCFFSLEDDLKKMPYLIELIKVMARQEFYDLSKF